jgi:hypothetical protein
LLYECFLPTLFELLSFVNSTTFHARLVGCAQPLAALWISLKITGNEMEDLTVVIAEVSATGVAITESVTDAQLSPDFVGPSVFDRTIVERVAPAATVRDGVTRKN